MLQRYVRHIAASSKITIIISISIIIITNIMKILIIVTVDSDSLHFAMDPVFIIISIISIFIVGIDKSKYTRTTF